MNVNFFETPCKEPARIDKLFGICDKQDGSKAFTDAENNNFWIAIVNNEHEKSVSFTPIDHCITIYKEGTSNQESTCDGMLTFKNSLYLVELKEKQKDWKTEAINQLKNTIRLLLLHHDLSKFRYKKAYACNKKHPNFKVIESSTKIEFFRETEGFKLDIQNEITIK
ncbi:MAG: hypothetical protein K9H26_03045 [Prolixibacteraceae bacterium]|nr:hypothetical protein [Prolixibacteraceae bacterium]